MIIMKLVNYLTPTMVLLTIINTLIITFLKPATNIFFILLPLVLLTILIFIKGMLSHKKSVYKYNLNLYLFIYLIAIIILAFILGIPANEIVLPLIIMNYMGKGSMESFTNLMAIKTLLISHGWTLKTALCFLVFVLFLLYLSMNFLVHF